MGTCDGRTQSARVCKPALLHLALRTFLRSFREEKNLTNFSSFSALHSIALALPQQTQCSVWYPSAKQKTRINPMFCLVPKRKAKNQRKPSAKQKIRGRRGSNLCSFLKKTRSSVRPSVRRKAQNQRKERLRPLLFPEENPSVRSSVRPGRFCYRKC